MVGVVLGNLGSRVKRASSGIGRPRAGLERPPARAAALVVAALLVPAAARSAPSVSDLTVRPPYFTPNGDGRTDTTEVSFVPGGAADSVGVGIDVRRVDSGALVGTPRAFANARSGVRLVQVWNPGPIAEGAYRFEILVVDGADSLRASAGVVADTTAPDVSITALAPNPWDPASEPPGDRLRVGFTVVSDSTTVTVLRVRTSAGVVTDSLGVFVGAGAGELTWDGLTSADAPAPTGVYSVRAIAADLAGNADTTSQSFTLDRDAPVFTSLPDSLQTDALPIVVAGSVSDFDRVVRVETSTDGGATWAAADSSSAEGPAVSFSTSLAFPGATPGFFPVRVRARDAVGHAREETVVVAYDHAIPAPISSTVLGDGTVRDGGTLLIRTAWSLPGLRVSANLSTLDFDWSPGDETVTEGPPGSYLIRYRVSPANIRRPDTKEIVITASTGIVAGKDTVSVRLVEAGPREGELVAVSRNRFDPEARETVTVAAERPTAALRVRIANLAGQVVRELNGTGWVEWDGRGEDGGICGSGVYFLRVEADGDAESRRVAIVRGGRP